MCVFDKWNLIGDMQVIFLWGSSWDQWISISLTHVSCKDKPELKEKPRENNLRYLLCCWCHAPKHLICWRPIFLTFIGNWMIMSSSTEPILPPFVPLGFQVASFGAFLKKIQVPQEADCDGPPPSPPKKTVSPEDNPFLTKGAYKKFTRSNLVITGRFHQKTMEVYWLLMAPQTRHCQASSNRPNLWIRWVSVHLSQCSVDQRSNTPPQCGPFFNGTKLSWNVFRVYGTQAAKHTWYNMVCVYIHIFKYSVIYDKHCHKHIIVYSTPYVTKT